jgi:two-component sensor histidine kinase
MTLAPAAENLSHRLGAALERIGIARSRDGILIAAAQAAREVSGAEGLCTVSRDDEPVRVAIALDDRGSADITEFSLPQRHESTGAPFGLTVTEKTSNLWVDVPSGDRLPIGAVVTVPFGNVAEPSALVFFWRRESVPISDDLPSLQAIAWATSIALSGRHADEIFLGQRLQIADLQRRIRNILAIVRSIVRRSGETAESQDDFTSHLEARIGALARIQSALLTFGHAGPELEDLIRSEMTASAARENQFQLSGPSIHLTAKAAQSLALAVHELTTNALKFGALSSSDGHIEVSWRVDESAPMTPRLQLGWTERGVAIVPNNPRRGFGHELIARVLPYELDATTAITFAQGGIRCTIDLPLNGRVRTIDEPRGQEFFRDGE